jgi:hypothetical protein
MALQPFVGPWPFLQFRNLFYTDGRTPWDKWTARRQAATYTQDNTTQTSMPWVGFEPTIPAFERAKTVHALDREVTQTRLINIILGNYKQSITVYIQNSTTYKIIDSMLYLKTLKQNWTIKTLKCTITSIIYTTWDTNLPASTLHQYLIMLIFMSMYHFYRSVNKFLIFCVKFPFTVGYSWRWLYTAEICRPSWIFFK